MSYLENTFCNFTPVTSIDYNNKINVISTSLFKMGSGGYKNFDKYLNGLEILDSIVNKHQGFIIRLFIDDAVYNDKDAMKYISALKHVSAVKFNCPNFYLDDHHVSTFGTIVRLFPMFDFINNDAKRVIIMDSDVKPDIIESSIELCKIAKKNKITDEYIIFHGRYHHVNSKKMKSIKYNNKTYIFPYCIASKLIGLKKIPSKIISDYLSKLLLQMNSLSITSVLSDYRITQEEKIKKCERNICYGVDEYFINQVLLNKLLEGNYPFCYHYVFDIANFYYFNHPKQYNNIVTSLSKEEYTRLFNSYMKREKLNKYSYSYIDDEIFNKRGETASPFMKMFAKSIINLLMQLNKEKDFRIFGPEQIYSLTSSDYKHYFYNECIRFINSERKDVPIKTISM